jgi:hypothetical protein
MSATGSRQIDNADQGLDDPGGITNELSVRLKPLVDNVQHVLDAHTRMENLGHLFDADPSLRASCNETLDGSGHYRVLHTLPPHALKIRTPGINRLCSISQPLGRGNY